MIIEDDKKGKIKITKNGPYVVSGGIPLKEELIKTDERGDSVEWEETNRFQDKEVYSLCRCGKTKTPPFCDGSHLKSGFNGKETASREKFETGAKKIKGPSLDLLDNEPLCAKARFCYSYNEDVWDLTREADKEGERKNVIKRTHNCSAGRLVVRNKDSHTDIEPGLAEEISLTEDPSRDVSGPLWVKGGVEIESEDGYKYEKRNRVTLCRCGNSKNKPFCDGSHIRCQYKTK